MKTSTLRVFALRQRANTFLAAMLTLVPLMGGCVSAVEDSSAFGFNGTPAGAAGIGSEAAKAETSAEPGEETATAAAQGDAAEPAPAADTAQASGTVAATASTTPGTQVAEAVTPAAESATAAETVVPAADNTILASGRTPIAAYAGATVSPSSTTTGATTGADAPKANGTLFASLFAQSEAKTPVRNSDTGKSRRVILKQEGAPVEAPSGDRVALASLPGVKSRESLFEIGQKASADYDAEILEEANGEEGTYEVASLSGFARLAPNGLMVQRPDVQTSCFEPKLVSMLRAVEQRFNTKIVVTSGYRSPTHNKRVNGARKSMHMACKAADIQVPGASKIAVANFLRSLPGRGGVGTYCHTTAVHVDVGRERDWNWACRRRRG